MPRLSRIVVTGFPHHVTQRGVRSMDIFADDHDRSQYVHFMREESRRHEMEILAWCLMTNHVHFIVVPHSETSLARGFGEAHKRYTRMKNFREATRGYLFQGRFSSSVLDEPHLLAATRYVENNPVAAGMVRCAWHYQWSSAAFHVGDVEEDPLVKDKSLWDLVGDWRSFLEEGARRGTGDAENLVMKATRTGRPAGDSDFIKKIERLTDRDLSRKKPGPKGEKGR